MLDWLNNAVLTITDPLLGWLLALDRSVALFIVAGASAAILTLVRLVTTNQDLLRRCNRDRKQLKRLIKEAKARKDKDALQRHKATMVLIAGKKIKSEGLPLLAALVPILLLATWCFSRLGYHPLRADEPIQLSAYFPVSSVGKMMHVVPVSGLRAEDGWVQEVAPATYQGQPHGRATRQDHHVGARLTDRRFLDERHRFRCRHVLQDNHQLGGCGDDALQDGGRRLDGLHVLGVGLEGAGKILLLGRAAAHEDRRA